VATSTGEWRRTAGWKRAGPSRFRKARRAITLGATSQSGPPVRDLLEDLRTSRFSLRAFVTQEPQEPSPEPRAQGAQPRRGHTEFNPVPSTLTMATTGVSQGAV
jgi:hypothetical protein